MVVGAKDEAIVSGMATLLVGIIVDVDLAEKLVDDTSMTSDDLDKGVVDFARSSTTSEVEGVMVLTEDMDAVSNVINEDVCAGVAKTNVINEDVCAGVAKTNVINEDVCAGVAKTDVINEDVCAGVAKTNVINEDVCAGVAKSKSLKLTEKRSLVTMTEVTPVVIIRTTSDDCDP